MTAAGAAGRRLTWVDLPAARPSGDPAVPEAIGAGFTHSGPDAFPEYGAAAFEAGGAVDVMPPCSVLAELTGQALEAGLERLTDDELVGVHGGDGHARTLPPGLVVPNRTGDDTDDANRFAATSGRDGQ